MVSISRSYHLPHQLRVTFPHYPHAHLFLLSRWMPLLSASIMDRRPLFLRMHDLWPPSRAPCVHRRSFDHLGHLVPRLRVSACAVPSLSASTYSPILATIFPYRVFYLIIVSIPLSCLVSAPLPCFTRRSTLPYVGFNLDWLIDEP